MNSLDDPDTIALLRRAHAGSDEAWRTLLDRHTALLLRLATFELKQCMKLRMSPEDLVQETLIDAFQMIGRYFDSPLPFPVWLRQRLIDRVGRTHRDHLVTQKRKVGRELGPNPDPDRDPMDPGTSPSGGAMRAEGGRVVHGAIGKLEDQDRELIFLIFFDNYDRKKIAAILNLTPATLRKRISRALASVDILLQSSHPEWYRASTLHAPR